MRIIPGVVKRYETELAAARIAFNDAKVRAQESITRRRAAFATLQEKAAAHNRQIDAFKAALVAAEPEAIVGYYELVFDESEYPDGFSSEYRVAFIAESKQLVVEVRLPTINAIVPKIERYKYIKSTDQIAETKKTEKSRQAIYIDAISQTVLRCLYESFRADPSEVVNVVSLNGYVIAVDPSTGRDIQPYIVSVRITRDEFAVLELRNVDPPACLKRMHAAVSRSPAELVAIKPIIDFNMVDPRFAKEQDVLSTLDTRPNLMELSPTEFESLITNLFQKMGLETKLTQPSRDGGVDCVAYDPRPVLGGKVIVQAKRYKNTVGVSAVRDLFGTVHNEGASKGILVTTSLDFHGKEFS